MAKKKNEAAPAPKPPAPGPAPSPEEVRRLHIETNAKDSLTSRSKELQDLLKGDLKKTDRLDAIAAVGEQILSVALHTRGRLRAASGRTDASLAAKGAFVKTATRKALKIADMFEVELTAWEDFVEAVKPAVEACTRTVKDLDLPGMKAAIGAAGEALFDDEGSPTEKAATTSATPAAQAPAPEAAAEPAQPTPEQPAAPANLPTRELPALGMSQGQVIDVESEPAQVHPLDGLDEGEAEQVVNELFDDFEEIGVSDHGFKRKDWKVAYEAWVKVWPEECELAITRKVYDLLQFACHERKPFSWSVPTEKDLFDHQRKLAIAAGE